jgi:hypothetical protein
MSTDQHRQSADFRAGLAAYAEQVRQEQLHWLLPDGMVWLRFDDRQFGVGDIITPTGYVPPEWQDLYKRGQLRIDMVYIFAAASPDHVSKATWNERPRPCYQVDPQLPLELDPDRAHAGMSSRMCKSATVVRILR